MIDELKYNDIVLTLPNIVGRLGKDDNPCEIRIERHVKPFVEALAKKHPQWRFVATRFWQQRPDDAPNYMEAFRFTVHDGREPLGVISTDYGRNRERVFTISNDRISDKRSRGDAVKTKDLNKAVKTVGKMFGVKTVNERLYAVIADAETLVLRTHGDRAAKFNRAYDHVAKYLMHYILDNYETLAPVALQHGASFDIVSNLMQARDEFQIMKEINECHQNNTGVVVLIHGSDYAVTGSDTNGARQTRIMSTDTLPPHIKRSIGMLKLVDVKTFVKGAGMRINDTAFFVMGENHE